MWMYMCLFFDKWMLETNSFCLRRHRNAEGFFFRKTCSWVHRLGCHSNPLGVPLSQGQQILTFYRSRCLKPTAAQQVCSDGGRRHRRPLWIFHKILLEETSDPRTKAQPRVITKLKSFRPQHLGRKSERGSSSLLICSRFSSVESACQRTSSSLPLPPPFIGLLRPPPRHLTDDLHYW